MPLVYSELASVYSMKEVNDPERRLAAANGQFLLVGAKRTSPWEGAPCSRNRGARGRCAGPQLQTQS
jgi:hypothetical protein